MGKVIFNSDDFGYSHGVNYGIVDAYQRGILTSTTLIVWWRAINLSNYLFIQSPLK